MRSCLLFFIIMAVTYEVIIMVKNDYLLLNDFIYQIYTSETIAGLKNTVLTRLRLIIPYSYASIMMCQSDKDSVYLSDPVCYPASFQLAEKDYMKFQKSDDLDWLLYSTEPEVVRESEMFDDQKRLNSEIYDKCYNKYGIYDSLQMSIVYNKTVYGILTLYRKNSDGAFNDNDVFYLHSLNKHINYLFHSLLDTIPSISGTSKLEELTNTFLLTRRESEIMGYIRQCLSDDEILINIPVSKHTLQKHIQNIYRKCGVSSRRELLRL